MHFLSLPCKACFVFFFLLTLAHLNAQDLTLSWKGHKVGFENKEGKLVIKRIYTYAEAFSEGFAVVEKDLKFGLINTEGKEVLELKYYDLGSFSEGLCYFSLDGKYGYLNKNREEIIPAEYDYAGDFIDGIAIVKKINPDTIKYGGGQFIEAMINPKGEIINQSWYSSVGRGSQKNFFVRLKGNLFSLDSTGKSGNVSVSDTTNSSPVNPKLADKMPEFIGGSPALIKYLQDNINYPISARKNRIQGKVFVQFVILQDGSVSSCDVFRPIHPLLKKEALRVVKAMPAWQPGEQQGVKVKTYFNLPIVFKTGE